MKTTNSDNVDTVNVPSQVIEQVLKYCEDKQIYDKLFNYQDFYYKLKQLMLVAKQDQTALDKQNRTDAMKWWNKLPMFDLDSPCKRMLAGRYYQREQSTLTGREIEKIWRSEFGNK